MSGKYDEPLRTATTDAMARQHTILGGGLDWEQAKAVHEQRTESEAWNRFDLAALRRAFENTEQHTVVDFGPDVGLEIYEPSLIDILASLPQINSRKIADDLIRELKGRGLEIREIKR